MQLKSRRLLVSLLVHVGFFAPTLAAHADNLVQFSTPSRGIGCIAFEGLLRCDVTGGVVPLPPRPRSCTTEVAYGQGLQMRQTGAATVVCAGDTAMGGAKIIPYGTTWRYGGFACSSSRNGLRCTNRSGHGFLIARGEAYRF